MHHFNFPEGRCFPDAGRKRFGDRFFGREPGGKVRDRIPVALTIGHLCLRESAAQKDAAGTFHGGSDADVLYKVNAR